MNMKGWHNESQRHSLAARGMKTIPPKHKGREIPMISNYEYETGQAAIEIAQNYVDAIENLYPRLKDPRARIWVQDRRKFAGFLMFMYEYQFDHNEVTELQGVVLDMFNETKSRRR